MEIIAHVRTDFPTKFGVPRQSGLIDALEARVVFTPRYRSKEALRGLDGFSHIWIVWQFSQALREGWSATVRPPRLGGNARMGVFATRSPFRPNPIGLSCVRLERIELDTPDGPVLHVRGADMLSSIRGIYPCGEGAGYAGGITSAAMDGMKAAEAIAKLYRPFDKHDEALRNF